jgi:hypothetical protein
MKAHDLVAFDRDAHRYTLRADGSEVPGVTSIINPVIGVDFSFVDPDHLAKCAALGTAVHDVINRDITTQLQAKAVDLCEDALELYDYFDAWREFILLSGFKPLLTEELVYSAKYGYAGQLDLFGELNGELWLPDIKRVNSVSRVAGVQTAGYKQALIETFPEYAGKTIHRGVLHLKPAAKWQLVPFNSSADLKVFLSALNIHNWKRKAL